MKVSIGYITCNNHELIPRTWEAVRRYTPKQHQIIALQNGSETGIMSAANTLLTSDELLSIHEARNLVLRYVDENSDALIWIDDDIAVCEGYIDSFITPLLTGEKVGMSGYETGIVSEDFFGQWYVDADVTGFFDYLDSPYLINMRMIKQVGIYDEALGPIVFDNTDLCLRSWKAGWNLVAIRNPGIKHWRGRGTHRIEKVAKPKFTWAYITSREQGNINRMRRKHPPGWRKVYGIPHGIFTVDTRLQFPERMGRLGGPEEEL